MKIRALTGTIILLAYIAVISLVVFIPHGIGRYFFDAFVILLMLAAGFEMANALTKNNMRPLYVFIVLNVFVGYTLFFVFDFVLEFHGAVNIFFASVFLNVLAVIIYTTLSKKSEKSSIVGTIFILLYPQAPLIYMLGLSSIGHSENRLYITAILLLFLVSTLSDTFAYLVGSTFKGPKLVPQISPKKTVSGFFGGILGGLIAGALVMLFSEYSFLVTPALSPLPDSRGFNIMHFLVLGGVGSLCVQLGDLIASYIKRKFEIKDFSSLLPGHGGVIDRIDGMMINGVFIYVYFMILSF